MRSPRSAPAAEHGRTGRSNIAAPSLFDVILTAGLAVAEDRARWLLDAGFYEVRTTDWPILRLLQAGPLPVGALAEPLEITQQATSKAITALQQRGYAARTSSPDDARQRLVQLTSDGQELMETAAAWEQDRQRQAVREWGVERIRRTTALLGTIAQSIEHEPGPGRNLRPAEEVALS